MRRSTTHALYVAAALVASGPLRAQTPARMMGAPYNDASRAFIDLVAPRHEMAVIMSEHAAIVARSDTVKAIARGMARRQTKEVTELKSLRRALFGSDSIRSPVRRAMAQMMGMDRMRDSAGVRAMMDSMRAMPRSIRGMVGDSMRTRGMRPDSMPLGRMGPDSTPMGRMMPDSMRMGRMMADSMRMRGGQPGAMMRGDMSGDFDRLFLDHMISYGQETIEAALLAEHSDADSRVRRLAREIREAQERDVAQMRRILATLPESRTVGQNR